MPGPASENLVSVVHSAAKLTSTALKLSKKKPPSLPSSTASKKKKKTHFQSTETKKNTPSTTSSAVDDATLKNYVSAINYSSKVSESAKSLLKSFKAPPSSTISTPPNISLHGIFSDSLNPGYRINDDRSAEKLSTNASELLYNELDLDWDEDYEEVRYVGCVLDMPWMSRASNTSISSLRKEVPRERKQQWVFKDKQTSRFGKLVKMCAKKLGSDATIEVFGRLGQETGLKEYRALINICIEKARSATDEDVTLQQIYKAYKIFQLAKENGFKIEGETYGKFMMYLIDFGMVEEFFYFRELISNKNPDSLPQLSYYEMLLWTRVGDEEKIQKLCFSALDDGSGSGEKTHLQEYLLLALCKSDRKEEFLMLLDTVDLTKVTSVSYLVCVFSSLGKLLLEPFAERYFLELKSSDIGTENISNFICEYTISIPNLVIEDVVKKFQALHSKLELLPSSEQYEKLVKYSCQFQKVHEALNIVDGAFESGVSLSLEAFHSILDACNESCEFNLVRKINSVIRRHDLKPNYDTFRMMILLSVKMKDFEGAYGMIEDMVKLKLEPKASIYNIILTGYLREKHIERAMNVLKQMEGANVKPDASTFGYLIANSRHEKDIIKYYNDMNSAGIPPTKHVFMALINAYAACGQFEKAKQIALDKRIPVKNLNEIKSVLVGALASNGQLSIALGMYEEIKQAECKLDPKAIKSLVEHFKSEGKLDKSLQLLEEINDSPYWVDACFRVISHCLQQEDLRSTIDLLKQLKDKLSDSDVATEVMFDEVFCVLAEKEATNMQFGLNLLKAIKEELGVSPSRKSLDFVLSACAYAKDAKAAVSVWKEYETAGLPYNVLSFVRMYQALLASGDRKSAAKILKKIEKDDAHVRSVIKACDETYIKDVSAKKKQNNAWKALAETFGLLE